MSYSRRRFLALASSAALAAPAADAFSFPYIKTKRGSAADRIRVAAIGINGMGWWDLEAVLKNPDVECVALCDVDKNVLDKRAAELGEKGSKVALHADYRKILDNKSIDAVIIGSPDHWHCLMMADACEAGKDIYVEKPIGNSIAECRAMVTAQEKYSRVVQVGQWQRSQKHFKDAVDFVHSGMLGPVRLVKVWGYFNWGKGIEKFPDASPPAGVDYNAWLGPAPKRAFNQNRFHGNFRWYWDYAGGVMTDWGVHLLDYALLGMKADTPKSVMATGGQYMFKDSGIETPDTLTAVYDFGDFIVQWEHAVGIGTGLYGRQHGIAFLGNNGTLVVDREGWEVIPDGDKMEAVPLTKKSDDGLELHTRNFVDVIRSRKMEDLRTPIQAGSHIAILSQMGNIAYRTGKKLNWDAGKVTFDDKEANRLIAKEYHNGYRMPKV